MTSSLLGLSRTRIRLLVVFGAALAINLATAAPTVMEGDGAELQTVGILGGVAHPPGYPTWTVCARFFATVWPGEPARRITALSCVAGAGALVAFLCLLERLGAPFGVALVGVILAGAGITFRWSSIYPEVYSVATLLLIVATERCVAALQRPSNRATLVATVLLTLAFTGYFAFAPAIFVLGAALLIHGPRDPQAFMGRAAMILAGIALGLTPFLYTAWADAAGVGMNYLRLVVDPEAGMFGLNPSTFDNGWERISWLVLGNSQERIVQFYAHPRLFLLNASDALAQVFLFDAGPAALILAPLGLFTIARRARWSSVMLIAVGVLSFLFTTALVYGRLLLPFLIPLTLVTAMLSAFGAGAIADRLWRRPRGRLAITLLIALVAAALPHAIRVGANASPIGPRAWRFEVEGGPALRGPLPRLDQERGPRETGERALELIPTGAFVIGRWTQLMTLYYLRDVEGRRRDLEFDPVYRGHELRYARWQSTHDVRERPFVLLGRSPEVEAYLGALDSVSITPRLSLYVQRGPMRGLSDVQRAH